MPARSTLLSTAAAGILLCLPNAARTEPATTPLWDTFSDTCQRLTTHPPRGEGDVELCNWRESGLPKPLTLRIRKMATVDRRLVHHVIGHLQPDDSGTVASAVERWCAGLLAALRSASR